MEFSKVVIVYTSLHGHTRNAVSKISEITAFDCAYIKPDLTKFEIVLFFCPTYGDEELPSAMENFLEEITVSNKHYSICELGNYFGFEEESFGILPIFRNKLNSLNWKEFFKPLSLDSLPDVEWDVLECWKKDLYAAIKHI